MGLCNSITPLLHYSTFILREFVNDRLCHFGCTRSEETVSALR
jgi:hypothetical protein